VENVTSDDDRDWIVARRKAATSPKTIANYHGLLSTMVKSSRPVVMPSTPSARGAL
jgi:hypothetical protein